MWASISPTSAQTTPLIRLPSASVAFLAVSLGYSGGPGPSGDTFGNFPTLGGTAVQLRLPGGHLEASVPIENPGSGLLEAVYVFVVPAAFTRGSILIRPGVVVGSETSAAYSYTQSESVAFGTATIPIGGGVATSTAAIITQAAAAAPTTGAGRGHVAATGGTGILSASPSVTAAPF